MSVDAVVSACKVRWKQGADDLCRLVPKSFKDRLPRAKTIRSAIYGNMNFTANEMRLLESFYLQRLRGISQMGLLHLVYPDARHSRFEHSMGVLHSLKGLVSADRALDVAPKDLRTLYAAALLHDCGHGPFSHTTETLLEISGLDAILRLPAKGEDGHVKPHERRCRDMVLNSDFHLPNLGLTTYGLRETLKSIGADPHTLVSLVTGQSPSPLLNLISGSFDVDKMDYFRRDAFFTGTMGGGVDMEAMQRWVAVVPGAAYPEIAYDRRLVGHLLHLLYAREHVYSVTAYHPVVRVAAVLLLVAGDLALRGLPPDEGSEIYAHIELFNDQELLTALELASSDPKNKYTALLRRVIQRLQLRRLHKRVKTLSRVQFVKHFSPCLKKLTRNGELPAFAYCLLSEIAGGKYLKHLGGSAPKDDVIILEMTPKLGVPSAELDGWEKQKATLDEMQIVDREAKSPISMSVWLNQNAGKGAADIQAKALRSYQLAIWKALVLAPASVARGIKGSEDVFVRDFAEALANDDNRRPFGLRHEWSATVGQVGELVTDWRAKLA